MDFRTTLEALTPIISQRSLDTTPVFQYIELYTDPDGNITGALATDRYVLARVGESGDAAAYINPVQAKQLLAQLKATVFASPMLDREAGTILGIPVTMPDDIPGQYPSSVARLLSDAESAEPSELPLGTGLSLSVMELVVKVVKPLNRGKSARYRKNDLGLRLEAHGNVILTHIDDLTFIVMPTRLHD